MVNLGASSPDATARVAEYIARVRPQDVPAEALSAARRHLLDTAACAVGATHLEPVRILRDAWTRAGGIGDATLLGTTHRVPVDTAACVNAHAANALDFDDSDLGYGHPGPPIVPAALAVAEAEGRTMEQLLTALVVGYEVGQRVGRYMRPSPERFGEVWGYATWQVFGGVAAVANLLGLEAEQVLHALGIAGTVAPVPSLRKLGFTPADRPWSWVKNGYGWAAEAAVRSCLLAQAGFRANRSIFDGEHGFWRIGGSDRQDIDALVADLGRSEPLILGCGLKPYACCRFTHTALDAVRRIQEQHEIRSEDVAAVEVSGFAELVRLSGPAPRSIIDAQFHVPHLVALELAGRSSSHGLAESDLSDETVATLRDRVAVRLDEAADAAFFSGAVRYPAHVEVTLRDGAHHHASADRPWGAVGGPPFTAEQRADKLSRLIDGVVGPGTATAVSTLDDQAKVSAFTARLRPR
jgi:2-methylcitrate dehydratase PrpD